MSSLPPMHALPAGHAQAAHVEGAPRAETDMSRRRSHGGAAPLRPRHTSAAWWRLSKQVFTASLEDYVPSMGAALAYYTVFSMAPLLLIVISVAGLVFGAEAARGEIQAQLQGLMGEGGASVVQGLLASMSEPAQGLTATALGLVLLLIGATTVFAELQGALDRIWRVGRRDRKSGWYWLMRARLLSLGMIMAVGFLLVVSLVASAILGAISRRWETGRSSPDWRPFQGPLAARSAAYALQVVNALFRWLTDQRYLLANPFAGVKVKGASRAGPMDTRRAFTEHEWRLIRDWADGAEFEAQWSEAAVVRMRFLLDFMVATGLRASELVGATLGNIRVDVDGSHWLDVRGKGDKEGSVVLPSLARMALRTYLRYRGLPVLRAQWVPTTPVVASIAEDPGPIGATRLWTVMKRYFEAVATMLATISPAAAVKARSASPHWMRHTHATHGLERGVDVTAMRDNLRHSSIAVTSTYLHTDDRRRASSLSKAFTR